jgi:hypothetical protein
VTPTAAPARPEVVTRRFERRRPHWMDRATGADHKSVGLLYIATALGFLALAVTEFMLVRLQRRSSTGCSPRRAPPPWCCSRSRSRSG